MKAKLYRRAQIEATQPDAEISEDDYEARALRALHTHRWLPDPMKRFEAQLKGGGSAWPQIVRDFHAYGAENAKEPRPRLRPRDISDHDIVMPWFNGIEKRAFTLIWYRGALGWTFSRIGDAIYRSKEDARRRYREAMNAVIENAVRGEFEI